MVIGRCSRQGGEETGHAFHPQCEMFAVLLPTISCLDLVWFIVSSVTTLLLPGSFVARDMAADGEKEVGATAADAGASGCTNKATAASGGTSSIFM